MCDIYIRKTDREKFVCTCKMLLVRVAFICTFIYYFVTFVKNMKMKLKIKM